MDVFIGFLKATIQIGGFYILNMVRNYVLIQMLLVVSTIFTIPPLHSFCLNPVCKDQIGIVYVGVFHHQTQNIGHFIVMEWILKVQPIFLMFSSGQVAPTR